MNTFNLILFIYFLTSTLFFVGLKVRKTFKPSGIGFFEWLRTAPWYYDIILFVIIGMPLLATYLKGN